MNYYVARNGQTYGPYSLEIVQKYLNEGTMSATDMARTEAMQSWTPLGQLLGAPPAPPPPPSAVPVFSSAQPQAYPLPQAPHAPPVTGINAPPSLHWGLVLLFALFTSGLFITVWAFVQSFWVKSIDPTSRATRDLLYAIFLPMIGIVFFVILAAIGGVSLNFDNLSVLGIGSLGMAFLVFFAFGIGGLVLHIKAFFGIRDSMDRYYNSVEPINLRLSIVMTLFFNVLYFQYHMTRIADWKRTGVLRP